jgi:hypothetical protein
MIGVVLRDDECGHSRIGTQLPARITQEEFENVIRKRNLHTMSGGPLWDAAA